MEALILAGGRSQGLSVEYKADLIVGGRKMVEHVEAALRDVPKISRVHVARGTGESLLDNLLEALSELPVPDDDHVLISSCDIPFVTSEAVLDFLMRCPPDYDIYYPIVRREACELRFPGVRRTYAKFREGTFTGGNLFVVRKSSLPPLAERLRRLIEQRKSPLKLAREFGIGLTLQFLISMPLGTLSVEKLERRVEQLAGLKAKAVPVHFPEIGTDIDKVSDLQLLDYF